MKIKLVLQITSIVGCMLFLSFYHFLLVHTPLKKSDAIVLLAGAIKERSPSAALLYHNGYAPLIILSNDGVFSRWSTKYNRNLYQVEWAEEELVELGVPREKIIKLPFYGSSTMNDVLAVKKYLLENGLKKFIVVTSDYHTRRAFWTFRYILKNYPSDISVFPVESISVGINCIILEYVKLVYYVLRYGLLSMVPDMNEVESF